MNTYTIQDAQVERQRIAEQRRKREQKEKDDYWFRESVGLPNGRVRYSRRMKYGGCNYTHINQRQSPNFILADRRRLPDG